MVELIEGSEAFPADCFNNFTQILRKHTHKFQYLPQQARAYMADIVASTEEVAVSAASPNAFSVRDSSALVGMTI
ncbi:MAG: hypothetical protein AAGM67_06860 [Bacteroidota bacterium]